MFDELGNFKQIDDAHGHAAGTAALISRADETMCVPGREEQRRQMPAVPPENHPRITEY